VIFVIENKKDFSNTTILVPPLLEQQHIVEELDLLSSIIEKKKAQLNELDNLAQSLFYEMFGDPITNEKRWEVKKLGEVIATSSGGTPSKSNKEYYEGGTIPWLRSGEVSQGFIYDTELFITEEGINNSSAKLFPKNTVVVAMYGATVGQVGIIKKEMTTNQAVCGILPNSYYNSTFLLYFLRGIKPLYLKVAAGGAQPNISQGVIKNTRTPIIQMQLQLQFASKIETIEKQKELIKQSIAEVETLFSSRMDYYFN
jgi:type I restriction enzyme S subunit